VTPMMRMLRIVLLSVLALLMVSTVVIGLGTSGTGLVEKGVVIAFAGLLVLAAVKVRIVSIPILRRSSAPRQF
jgi:hypothetical protein